MGLLTGLLTLPIAPVRGVTWVAEQVRQQAEEEYYDPAELRRRLEDVDETRARGEIGEDEAEAIEDELVRRLLEGRERAGRREA